ncbi:uncharacterized protein B0T15DRAFT_189798 [Chaetomium strumarium]|uniref:Uncharacterized protein n=1 Tax=Chaetomium strumarium TaxID=1170767 RepID=A0AAJ0GS76_9PEZI|nr:hypothetical protein B0T15DRAFT_189798 [Chaetomium strumarium]
MTGHRGLLSATWLTCLQAARAVGTRVSAIMPGRSRSDSGKRAQVPRRLDQSHGCEGFRLDIWPTGSDRLGIEEPLIAAQGRAGSTATVLCDPTMFASCALQRANDVPINRRFEIASQ